MNLELAELLKLNENGLIPGPQESSEHFQERVGYCLSLNLELLSRFELPNVLDTTENQQLIQEAAPITRKLYGFVSEWVPILFSNHKLAPWHGGCAWIFQLTENTPMGAFLQLRTAFAKGKRYLGLYNRKELVAHELSHVGRMAYQEPIFEEVLAYRSSESKFRRWWGPIVKSSWEALLFVFLLLLSLSVDLYALFHPALYSLALKVKLLPLLLLFIGIVRLWVRHNEFEKCLRNLNELTKDRQKSEAVIYRLTDKEIILFSSSTTESIRQYIQQQDSLRWKVISTYL